MTRITALAFAASLFALVPACRAQVDTPGDVAAPAQQQQPSQATPDSAMVPAQPRIRVVRLSDVEGSVKILRADQTQFPQAVMNMPLTEGSQIDTGADGRAEIEMEDGSVARITPNSSLKIAELRSTPDGPLDTTLEQRSGLIYYELRYDPKNTFHVDFSGRSASPTMNSTFRIDLKAAPQELAVLDGKVQVSDAKVPVPDGNAQGAAAANSFSVQVLQGKTIQFPQSAQGKPETAQYSIKDWVTPNGFDDWNEQRDQEAAEQAQNQTPARVQQGGGSIMDSAVGFGWSDLDNAGSWYPLPGYGMVWQPYGVGADFDPYANGMWADFGGGLGYSWVSGYPWGWLPYNCGAWSYIGSFGWGWTPGMYGCGRSGFGIGIGLGYGGYGRGSWNHRWRNGQYPHTNIHRAPPGYRSPAPPAIGRGGQRPPQIV
ncbi:MAG: FecR family protein, partial [Acidobacteriaceae bacterium]